jgi:FAD synthase
MAKFLSGRLSDDGLPAQASDILCSCSRWAQLQGASAEDGGVHKTVLNIGKRPSIVDGEQRTVELHIMHSFAGDFYGKRIKMAMVGFIR